MKQWSRLGIYLLTATLVGLIALGSHFGLFAIFELRAYDALKQISPKEERDRRIAHVRSRYGFTNPQSQDSAASSDRD
jgi:CHASE2 domain-containing sensor protein